MSTFLASVAAYTVLLTTVLAVVERLSRPAALPDALAAHRVLPAGAVRATATAVTAIEVGLCAVLVVGLLRDTTALVAGALAAGAVLFAGYGGYALRVTSTGLSGPCGCGRTEVPMSGWVAFRAFTLAGLAVVGAALGTAVLPLAEAGSALAVVLLAAGTFGLLLWHLPAAMYDPLTSGVSG